MTETLKIIPSLNTEDKNCEVCNTPHPQLISNADGDRPRYFCDWNCFLGVNDKRLSRIESKINEIIDSLDKMHDEGAWRLEKIEEPKA